MELESANVKVGDTEFDLAALAGVNMDDVTEVIVGELMPRGNFRFKVTDVKLGKRETKKGDMGVFEFQLEVVNPLTIVEAMSQEEIDKLIGKKHTEMFWINDLDKTLGIVKNFMKRAGHTASGTLPQVLDAFVGLEFTGAISHSKNPNDTDRVNANLNVGSVKPVEPTAGVAGVAVNTVA